MRTLLTLLGTVVTGGTAVDAARVGDSRRAAGAYPSGRRARAADTHSKSACVGDGESEAPHGDHARVAGCERARGVRRGRRDVAPLPDARDSGRHAACGTPSDGRCAWLCATLLRSARLTRARRLTATLTPARSFELRLLTADGEPVNLRMPEDLYQEHRNSPLLIGSVDGAPVCALGEQQSERFRASGTPPLCLNFGIYPLGDGRYRVDVPQEFEGALVLMVHSPEVIRYYLRTLEPNEWQSGTVEVRLPKPGMMVLEIDLEAWRTAYKDLSQLSLRVAPQAEAPSTLLFYSNAFVGTPILRGDSLRSGMSRLAHTKRRCICGIRTRTKQRFKCPKAAFVRQKIAPKPFDVADYRGARQVRVQIQTPRRQVAGGRVLPRGTHARLRTSAHPAGRQTGQKRRVRAKQPVRESSGHRRLQRHRLPNLCE
jgi:hypothetical protein